MATRKIKDAKDLSKLCKKKLSLTECLLTINQLFFIFFILHFQQEDPSAQKAGGFSIVKRYNPLGTTFVVAEQEY